MPSSAPRRTAAKSYVDTALMPDVSKIVIDDGKPVDNLYSERQMRLLVESLYTSWNGPGEGRPFIALANVGVFMTEKKPPVVPDVLVSLDVLPGDRRKRENLSYFVWIIGKLPEIVVEIVSNKVGGELEEKKAKYASMGIPYYIVWDEEKLLEPKQLHCFVSSGGVYEECEPWFPLVKLGVEVWKGKYQDFRGPWLRWRDAEGNLILTGAEQAEKSEKQADREKERAQREKERAEREKVRADDSTRRADALAAKLRALGVDPDAV